MKRRLFLKSIGVGSALFNIPLTINSVESFGNSRKFNVVIVGSDPAGLSLTGKLSRNGVSAAVLESGI